MDRPKHIKPVAIGTNDAHGIFSKKLNRNRQKTKMMDKKN